MQRMVFTCAVVSIALLKTLAFSANATAAASAPSIATSAGANAAGVLISPLPLAEKARKTYQPPAWQHAEIETRRKAERTRLSVLQGMHDWDALDAYANDLAARYKAGKLSADDYRTAMSPLIVDDIGNLSDVELWARERPQSYAAWYTLGSSYSSKAWSERGTGVSKDTSKEQFERFVKYGRQAGDALRKSVQLTDRPILSYSKLIVSAVQDDRQEERGSTGLSSQLEAAAKAKDEGLLRKLLKQWEQIQQVSHQTQNERPICPAPQPPSDARFKTTYDQMRFYVCKAYAADPNYTTSIRAFFDFYAPRWGGDLKVSEALLEQIKRERHARAETLVALESDYWQTYAAEAYFYGDYSTAVQSYIKAFDANPVPENLHNLRSAALYANEKLKDKKKAIEISSRIIQIAPDDGTTFYNRGVYMMQSGEAMRSTQDMVSAGMLGVPEAQNNVGYLYMMGQGGLPKDLQQAKAWLTLAANQGFQHSKDKLPLVEEMLRQEEAKKSGKDAGKPMP